MSSKISKTCLECNGKIDVEEEDSDKNATKKEKNNILIVQEEEIIVQHILEEYITKRHCFPREKMKQDEESMKDGEFVHKKKECQGHDGDCFQISMCFQVKSNLSMESGTNSDLLFLCRKQYDQLCILFWNQ